MAAAASEVTDTPANVMELEMKERFRAVFNKAAFGIDGSKEQEHSSKTRSIEMTQTEWHQIVACVSNWGPDLDQQETVSKEEREQIMSARRLYGPVGYTWVKMYKVVTSELPDGTKIQRLHRKEPTQPNDRVHSIGQGYSVFVEGKGDRVPFPLSSPSTRSIQRHTPSYPAQGSS